MTLMGSTSRKTIAMLLAAGAGVLALSAPAWPAQSETQQGAQILTEVQSGKLNGSSLSSAQYTHVGQYLMSRAFGSTQTYEAMDSLMDRMMGTTGSDQMYRYLGERYYGKSPEPNSRYGATYGWMGSMMRSYGGSSGYPGMMGAYLEQAAGSSTSSHSAYPMMGGGGMMGRSYTNVGAASSSGWPTGAIVAVAVLGALLIGGVIFLVSPKLQGRGGHSASSAS